MLWYAEESQKSRTTKLRSCQSSSESIFLRRPLPPFPPTLRKRDAAYYYLKRGLKYSNFDNSLTQ